MKNKINSTFATLLTITASNKILCCIYTPIYTTYTSMIAIGTSVMNFTLYNSSTGVNAGGVTGADIITSIEYIRNTQYVLFSRN